MARAEPDLLEMAERAWRGEPVPEQSHPFSHLGRLAEVAPGTAFVASFGNVTAFDTDQGLVLVDTGGGFFAAANHEAIRAWSPKPVHTAVYTHGHIDHVFGLVPFEAEAQEKGWPRPHVVAHENLPRRFDRYRRTTGYNAVINRRQFQAPRLRWPENYRYPDQTFRDRLSLEVGGVVFELRHGRGETDDHVWAWVPERGVLCTGDFFVWTLPNAGNPQKVQRYAGEWALALREMLAQEAEILLPGHGLPIVGKQRIKQALEETAELLESLEAQALELINRGARLDEVVQAVRAPAHLLERPYLRPIYDEPEFVVRNIWRHYAGWWDGDPAHLKPAPAAELAAELAGLAGGPARLAERAREVLAKDRLRLAGHLAELARQAAPEDAGVAAVYREVNGRRAEAEISTMSRGVFAGAVREAEDEPAAAAGEQASGGAAQE